MKLRLTDNCRAASGTENATGRVGIGLPWDLPTPTRLPSSRPWRLFGIASVLYFLHECNYTRVAMQPPVSTPPHAAALTVGDVFAFRPPRDQRKPLCRVRCDDWLVTDYRACNRVLVVGEFKPNGEGRFELRFVGFPAGPGRELDRLGITVTAAAVTRPSRPSLKVLRQDKDSVTIQCKCGAAHRIDNARVTELFLEKMLGGTSLPVVILTSELDDG